MKRHTNYHQTNQVFAHFNSKARVRQFRKDKKAEGKSVFELIKSKFAKLFKKEKTA